MWNVQLFMWDLDPDVRISCLGLVTHGLVNIRDSTFWGSISAGLWQGWKKLTWNIYFEWHSVWIVLMSRSQDNPRDGDESCDLLPHWPLSDCPIHQALEVQKFTNHDVIIQSKWNTIEALYRVLCNNSFARSIQYSYGKNFLWWNFMIESASCSNRQRYA